jgi:hypothetical protein
MRALFDGRDFHLYLEESGRRSEVSALPTTQLTTGLERLDGTDLGKRVDLIVGEAKNPDGIDLSFFDSEDGMDDVNSCIGIRVVMNRQAYNDMLRLGQAASTYGNTENKVRVVGSLN